METILVLVNALFVLVYGAMLTFEFSSISIKKNIAKFFICMTILFVIQFSSVFILGLDITYLSYPLTIHLTLFLFITIMFKCNPLVALFAVLSAYLFCSPRQWIGTFVSMFFNYSPIAVAITEISITIPLLVLIYKYIAPYIQELKNLNSKILKQFIFVPLFYYVMVYVLTVYTDLLYSGGAVVVEFLDSAIVVLYYVFSVAAVRAITEKGKLENEQNMANLQLKSATDLINQLRHSEKQSAIHRHDLVHHMNYINSCIKKGKTVEAQQYIEQTCNTVIQSVPKQYVENESLNLILSLYIANAEEKGISIALNITISNVSRFQITDLCSLFANAFSNAILASDESKTKCINLELFEKNEKICINMSNSYQNEPLFIDDLPISSKEGHGIGVKSMVQVIEKYNGVYRFETKDDLFYFQASI